MRFQTVIAVLALLVAASLAQEEAKATPTAKAEDVGTMDGIVKALYDVISGPAGKKRDWDRMRSLFIPDARMIAVGRTAQGEGRRRVMTVEDYIKASGPVLEERGFFEKEIARRTEQFGDIVHVFSTYEARQKAEDEKPMMRGINSIQLHFDGKRWWILTVYWQQESQAHPLPEKYLKDG